MNERDLLDDARRELSAKTRAAIEEETAFKWAARALVAYERFEQTQRHRETVQYQWLRESEHYLDEAVEHAALADSSGAVLIRVRQWVHRHIPPR